MNESDALQAPGRDEAPGPAGPGIQEAQGSQQEVQEAQGSQQEAQEFQEAGAQAGPVPGEPAAPAPVSTSRGARRPWYSRRAVVLVASVALLAGFFGLGWGANELLTHDDAGPREDAGITMHEEGAPGGPDGRAPDGGPRGGAPGGPQGGDEDGLPGRTVPDDGQGDEAPGSGGPAEEDASPATPSQGPTSSSEETTPASGAL